MEEDRFEETPTEEDYSETYADETPQGDPMEERHNVVAEIFNTSRRIEMLRRRWRGDVLINGEWFHDESKELASDKFINKQLSQMEAIITETNSFSRKTDTETKRILKDSVHAFVEDAVNDDSVETKDIRTMTKGYEHSLELFLGLVEFGHGANVFKDAMAGLNSGDVDRNKEKKTVGEWLHKRL